MKKTTIIITENSNGARILKELQRKKEVLEEILKEKVKKMLKKMKAEEYEKDL